MAERIDSGTWWQDATPQGFTALCRAKFGEFVDADVPVTVKVLQLRADMLATVQAMQQARQTGALRRAVVLERN